MIELLYKSDLLLKENLLSKAISKKEIKLVNFDLREAHNQPQGIVVGLLFFFCSLRAYLLSYNMR